MQIGRELALADVVARELARVGIEGGELHVAEAHADVAELRGGEQVHFACDLDRRVTVHLALQFDLRTRFRIGRKSRDAAAQPQDAGRERGLNRVVRETCRAVDELHGADSRRERGLGLRRSALRVRGGFGRRFIAVLEPQDFGDIERSILRNHHARIGLARDDPLDVQAALGQIDAVDRELFPAHEVLADELIGRAQIADLHIALERHRQPRVVALGVTEIALQTQLTRMQRHRRRLFHIGL